MTIPTADAIRLAVKLSGHTVCALSMQQDCRPCDGCLGDAATIDAALLLPQKNAALLLAQGLYDSWDKRGGVSLEQWYELRDALAAIKTPAMPHLQPTTTPLAPWPPKA